MSTSFSNTPDITEVQVSQRFDSAIGSTGLFRVISEVAGTLIQPRPGQIDKAMRIDRILTPKPNLIAMGWTYGAIGIELKSTRAKLGPAISQAIDYSRSTWQISGGVILSLSYILLYPFPAQYGDISSVMAHNRIGTANSDFYALQMNSGGQNLLAVHTNGEVKIGSLSAGSKSGHRSGYRT